MIGIFKAYCTRVGGGPFPTEQINATGEQLRQTGKEFGAVSGRPRRTGWLDLPALKQAILLNGVTQLVMTKADVLDNFEQINVCTHYLQGSEKFDYLPYEIDQDSTEPVYTTFQGWQTDISGINSVAEIPDQLNAYIQFLESALNVPVRYLSVGPDRTQTIAWS